MIRLAGLLSLTLALPVSAFDDPGAAAKRDFAGFLKLFEGEFDNFQPVSPSYPWVNPEATRVGINLRWIQAGFTREGVQ